MKAQTALQQRGARRFDFSFQPDATTRHRPPQVLQPRARPPGVRVAAGVLGRALAARLRRRDAGARRRIGLRGVHSAKRGEGGADAPGCCAQVRMGLVRVLVFKFVMGVWWRN